MIREGERMSVDQRIVTTRRDISPSTRVPAAPRITENARQLGGREDTGG